jgi:hypothetical protein
VTEQDVWLLEMYAHYKNGVLPFAGGLFNQPNLYVEAMGVIDGCSRSFSKNNGG